MPRRAAVSWGVDGVSVMVVLPSRPVLSIWLSPPSPLSGRPDLCFAEELLMPSADLYAVCRPAMLSAPVCLAGRLDVVRMG